jgi:Type IV secretion-system coupling protein DNA-binding domain/TraM recognition site of TraD and TraG
MKPDSRRHARRLEKLLDEPGRPLHSLASLAHHALSAIEHFAPALLAAALMLAAAVLVLGHVRRRRLARGARVVTVGVPPEVDTGGAVLLWSALHDLIRPRLSRLMNGQPHLSWEVVASEAGTRFRVWVPASIPPGLIERAVASAWPGASTATQDAPDDRFTGAVQVASELALSGPDWFSLNAAMKPDPLPLILGQLSGLRGEQRALVQVLARPATTREQRRLRMAARRLRAGISPHGLVRFLDFFVTYRKPKPPTHDPTISPDVRDVMTKSSQPLFRCLVRVAVSAESSGEARGRIHGILGGFAAYEGRLGLRRRGVRRARAKLEDRALGRRAFLASTGELAALAHLPGVEAIPGVVMAGAREVAPPPGLPRDGKPLGLSADGKAVNISVADARRHMHLLGPTGVGKTTLIARLVLADFDAGRGAVVIDPKGDLVEDLLARIPPGREHKVDLLDPLDEAPPGLNVLDSPDRDLGVDQLVGIFSRVFERYWGPRTDDILRAALLTLSAASPTSTLADVPRLLSDRSWQRFLVAQIDDPVLEAFWAWYGGLSDALRAQASGPLLNKLRAFLLRRPVRAIVGQSVTTLDVPRALDQGRLLLAKLPKGTLGEDTSRLLGSFLFARVWQAALARAGEAPEQRRDASCYVDEVQNYLNLPTPFEDVLAEARSYRLALCLAHQNLGQLPRDLREAIAANARSKVYFQLSRDDATTLDREVRPELSAHDLAHLPVFTAAVRLCNGGQPGPAFTLRTEPLGDPIVDRAQALRESARQRYGHASEQAEAALVVDQRNPAVAPATQREHRPKMAPADGPSSPASDPTSSRASN